MCGIIGYIGRRDAIPVLIKGLEHLEYRGYDSAGIACLNSSTSSNFFIAKEKGKLSELKSQLTKNLPHMHVGIGHTRWATHGEPSKLNAHPHLGEKGRIALVHNGIVENYAELKDELKRKGHHFKSKTDTEVAAHLIEYYYHGDLREAIRKAVRRMRGFFAFVVISRDEPNRLFACKRSNPLVIGVSAHEHFVASDISALLPYTKKVIYLEDDELVELQENTVTITQLGNGRRIQKKVSEVNWNVDQAQKGGFKHFMLKEIHEQPRVLAETLKKRIVDHDIEFDTLDSKIERSLANAKKVFIVSCGTAYHAGMVARYMFEEYVRIPTEVHVSSEFRYADPIIDKGDIVVLITQSGETADTLAALREAKQKGALTLAIVNVVGSTIAREADAVIYTHAGPEIGVASTKAYLAQLVTVALFVIKLGLLRKKISRSVLSKLIDAVEKLPYQLSEVLKQEPDIRRAARKFFRKKNFLYLGRGYNFPTALEGALKLKEITYAHAHGYAAGEMKHGPIALIDSEQLVVCLAPHSKTYEKMISNIEEIHARRGIIISIATSKDQTVSRLSRLVFWIPKTLELFSPILTVVPLQLFAYYVAILNSRDVDQPRNLAKSVTVE
ncbi:MAG: glutamine--fructose-6-phosphate aminotransferase [Omnitrophica bacterium RIFCSPHIGHO2_02_FULL_46_11]|nr:MAG: glutamine--fructose-6-phosphate aminotransferase [Omnitrophica bacterium RIFCSPLOWO2_01_FULL_45_10b]OGW87153.1 MAG: glutamine--fructose-6-phosphate aminotransferase [Omnitrophica bacterium RIFCSPHIGHO2_02_FULL_46_11]